ncbi:MAG: MMPL family transporter [Gammaproteobacteria bacterium]
MTKHTDSLIHNFLLWWERQVVRFPWTLLLAITVLCGLSLHYTVNNLGFNTNTSQMLSPDLPFQKNRHRIEQAFPKDAAAFILVVNGDTPEETSQAARLLADQLNQHTESFQSVYIPTDNAFFRQQALLFLNLDELDDLAKKLTDAQPFIGHLAQNYNLAGLFEIIRLALEQTDQSLPMDLKPLLTAIDETIVHRLNKQPVHLSWQNLLAENRLNTESKRTIVIAKPKLIFTEILPADIAYKVAREISDKIMADNPAVRIRMTGETALEHEELESVGAGAVFSGLLSLFLVCTSLWLGFRSFQLLFVTFIALVMGLILTAGFATLSVGHLNIISIAFAVLYIGLGVDYATHICLRYRECKTEGMNNAEAIKDSVNNIGFSLFLCAFTTAIGFLAFIPTDYAGVSELGIISSGGMFIGLGLSLSIVPALLTLLPVRHPKPFAASKMASRLATVPFRHAKAIRILSIILAIASSFALTELTFDSNPINLRDPNSESVATIKELLKSQIDSPFSLTGLANNLDQAEELAAKLQKLPSVHETITLSSFVADDQDEKLYVIEELDLILGAQLKHFNQPLTKDDQRNALINFAKTLQKAISGPRTDTPLDVLHTLLTRIETYIKFADSQPEPGIEYAQLEDNILGLLPYTMNRLSTSLTAKAYGIDDLPPYLTEHWLSTSGLYKVLITPAKDQNKLKNLKEFVKEVQSVDDSVSGLPVADQASGEAVVNAFIEAFGGALVAIIILLLFLLKSFKQTLLIIGPLLLASLLTGATNVVLNNPFNFANIIALPLLMGMGVDSSIHIAHRLHGGWSDAACLLQSSTARGVFFSSLTTLCSFSSLAFTPHQGTASMGLLLAIGISFTLICTLIVLPAFSSKKI